MRRPDLRRDISRRDGQQSGYCKGCKKAYSYSSWAHHCTNHYSRKDGKTDVDDDGGTYDGAQRGKQLKAEAKIPAKTIIRKKSEPTTEKEPMKKKKQTLKAVAHVIFHIVLGSRFNAF